ncbi:MAG TPA: hypothetical protein VLB01_03355 [Thermodesulfobacteriota bacterium]|nr:hypothetical protein [Thermodesulfobacteriota bacterium]
MKKKDKSEFNDKLRDEYDFARLKGGVRGKYAKRYNEGTNLVLLAPDVAEAFLDEESVNEALRLLIKIARTQTPPHYPFPADEACCGKRYSF